MERSTNEIRHPLPRHGQRQLLPTLGVGSRASGMKQTSSITKAGPCRGSNMSSGGRASRDKGARAERAIVRVLQERGLAAERVPLSGSMRGRFGGDISMPALGCDLRGEAKVRGHGFTRLYDWLDGRDFLAL